MNSLAARLRAALTRIAPTRPRQVLVGVAFLAVLAGLVLLASGRLGRPVPLAPAAAAAPGLPAAQLPAKLPEATPAGQLLLDDFQVSVPPTWVRRKEWEDDGPGTKLFLTGPKVGTGQLVIGIDVYPLRSGTTLEQFVEQYSAKWNLALLVDKPATFCEQSARMLALTESGIDKLYLVTVWRDKGFAVGMLGPAGHTARSTAQFREVVDTFQLYE